MKVFDWNEERVFDSTFPAPITECHCTVLFHDGLVCHVEVCPPCADRVVARAESFLV